MPAAVNVGYREEDTENRQVKNKVSIKYVDLSEPWQGCDNLSQGRNQHHVREERRHRIVVIGIFIRRLVARFRKSPGE